MANVRDFGAIGDGITLNTKCFQDAINQVHARGGGKIFVPAGKYLISNLYLKSNITLELDTGTKIIASTDLSHYDAMRHGHNKDRQPYHLFIAHQQVNIVICGSGTIDGQGPEFWRDTPDKRGWYKEKQQRISPLFEINDCKNIKLIDFQIVNSPGWTLHFRKCRQVFVRGLVIENHTLGPNTDAIDINGCKDVIVSDCFVETGDDAIVLKSSPDASSCERISVTNCVLRSNCAGFKLGATETFFDIKQISFSNSIIYKSTRPIAVYALEGGAMEDITISNIVCDTHGATTVGLGLPIHLDLRRRNPESKLGAIRNFQVVSLLARTGGKILLTAEPGAYLENIILRDVHLIYDKHIIDPFQYKDWFSAQFSNRSLKARIARSAMAIEGAKNLYVDNFIVSWPERAETEFDFSAIWIRNVQGIYCNNPFLKPYRELLIDKDETVN